MKNIIYIPLLCLSFSACEIVVDLDIPQYEPVLVLNSVVRADSIIEVNLSNSVGSFELNQIKDITDANINVFENDQFIGEMEYTFIGLNEGEGEFDYQTGEYIAIDSLYAYVLNQLPKVDSEYRFEVSHDAYENVQASTKLTKPISFVSHDISNIGDQSGLYKLSFTFNDEPGEHYYRLRLINKTNQSSQFTEFQYNYPMEFETSDPSIISSSVSEGGGQEEVVVSSGDALFDDVLFDGEEKTISIDFSNWYYLDDETSNSIYLELSSISKDYFDYMYSYQRQLNYYGGELFAGEPVQVFTNVQNGLGILGASNKTSVKLILPE